MLLRKWTPGGHVTKEAVESVRKETVKAERTPEAAPESHSAAIGAHPKALLLAQNLALSPRGGPACLLCAHCCSQCSVPGGARGVRCLKLVIPEAVTVLTLSKRSTAPQLESVEGEVPQSRDPEPHMTTLETGQGQDEEHRGPGLARGRLSWAPPVGACQMEPGELREGPGQSHSSSFCYLHHLVGDTGY